MASGDTTVGGLLLCPEVRRGQHTTGGSAATDGAAALPTVETDTTTL